MLSSGVGFTGMCFILWTLIQGLWKLVFVPNAPAVIAPVIPGFNIPGVGITVPLITGWLALFVVITVHEFSHGVVSKSHDIPVQSSGLLIFGPLLGAFVEPEEKKLKKAEDSVQYSVFAAGPFSNVLAALVAALILFAVLTPLFSSLTVPAGVRIASVTENSSAANAGVPEDAVIVAVDGIEITDTTTFITALETVRVGDTVLLSAEDGQEYAVVAGETTTKQTRKGYLGVVPKDERVPERTGGLFAVFLATITWIEELFTWIFILSLGIGLANLLPLGPVDGGQMVRTLFNKLFGANGDKVWKRMSYVTLAVILVLLFVPMIKGFF